MQIEYLNDKEAVINAVVTKPIFIGNSRNEREAILPDAEITIHANRENTLRATMLYTHNDPTSPKFGERGRIEILWESLVNRTDFRLPNDLTIDTLDEIMFSSVVPSMIGEDVEPDGTDPYGFPSVLRAFGLI